MPQVSKTAEIGNVSEVKETGIVIRSRMPRAVKGMAQRIKSLRQNDGTPEWKKNFTIELKMPLSSSSLELIGFTPRFFNPSVDLFKDVWFPAEFSKFLAPPTTTTTSFTVAKGGNAFPEEKVFPASKVSPSEGIEV
jgi:hypothetical protein